jgi:hypothetical protein
MAAELSGVFARPFAEQSAYFKQKLALPSQRWDDLLGAAHDHGFIVAGAMKADLVADLKAAVQSAIDQGKTLQWFRGEFETIVQKHGWTGWTGEGSKDGVAWRTQVIYNTNLRTSHAAGRWAQMTDPEVLASRPYWRYVHRSHTNPRLEHKAWSGKVLPAMDPWFNSHYPPNGFGCKCTVEAINEREMNHLGKSHVDAVPEDGSYQHVIKQSGEVVTLPKGIQYGWDYAPGRSATENALAARQNRLETLDNVVARQNVAALVQSPIFTGFFNGAIRGEFPVAVLSQLDQKSLGASSAVVLLSDESIAAHVKTHPEITQTDYRQIQEILDKGEVYKQGETRLVYLTLHGVKYRAALKRTKDGKKNYFLSLFKNETGAKPKLNTRIR